MGATPNYGLYVTEENDDPSFLAWRKDVCGVSNSNMTKIDSALGTKAQKSSFIDAKLTVSGWSGSSAPFSQVLAISGLHSDSNGSITISSGATEDERAAARSAILSVSQQAEGSITILADGDKPEIELPVTVLIVG